MKASNIGYTRPRSLTQAFEILVENDAAVPLAGGQSLMVALNMRLSAPQLVVDIGELDELSQFSCEGDTVILGALTRHRQLLESELLREKVPLLPKAATHIAHAGIRNRGTLGGSLAYADPAAELPACAVALGATIVIGSLQGTREVKAESFFKGLFETDLQAGELILAVRIPAIAANTSIAFAELARRQGDFAIAGVTAVATMAQGRIESARFVYFGCTDFPRPANRVAAAVMGLKSPLAAGAELDTAVGQDINPSDTAGMRGDTKRHLATVLTCRALDQLFGSEARDV